MSQKHLSAGSVEPPRVDGKLRIYSMLFCPFAKRARLVAKVKNLPHDIVNINIHQNKPEWYLKIHPKGQVPALLDGDNIVIESLDVADYLEEKYPKISPLYPSDPAAKKRDQEIIRNVLGTAIEGLPRVMYGSAVYTLEQAMDILLPPVQPLEEELTKRGTPFFGGDKPGMIDFMLWPWAEFVPILPHRLGVEKLKLNDDQIPSLRKWRHSMLEVPVIQELSISLKTYIELVDAYNNKTVDYDAIASKVKASAKV